MGIAVLCAVMAVTLLIGVPIGASLLLSCIALVLVQPVTTMEFLAQSMYSSVASFTLICLPFFMLCGSIMDTGGISEKLVRFAKSLVGNITGGLGIVSVIACMFFGAISGRSPAGFSRRYASQRRMAASNCSAPAVWPSAQAV